MDRISKVGTLARLKTSCSAFVAAGLLVGLMAAPASAQADDRLERIETQMRALQRVVFPGGDQRFFEPEITPGAQIDAPGTTRTSTSALTDTLTRIDTIETQLARLTAATEVNSNALTQLETRVNWVEEQVTADQQPTGVIDVPADDPAEVEDLTTQIDEPDATEADGPTPERLAGVQGIVKPATGDQGDDEYTYGFRLWDAGYFAEAQQQLALFVEQYPDHRLGSHGRNLLGRAFLDAGDARRAATHFFENYQSDKQSARAPDSLLFLSEAMIELGDTNRACIALAEFGETYPALATGRLQSQYDGNTGRVDCD